MTRTRSRNDKDVRMAGDHGQMISGGAGHSSGHAIQADGMPQTFRQGWYAMVMQVFFQDFTQEGANALWQISRGGKSKS